MQKIWNAESQAYLYAIDEVRLHQIIRRKKQGASRVVRHTEWMGIGLNALVGLFLLVLNWVDRPSNAFVTAMGLYMLAASVFFYLRRRKRLRGEHSYDRTLLGDLRHAVASATYQVQTSALMIMYFVPFAALFWLQGWSEGKETWKLLAIMAFCVVMLVAAYLEHRHWHVKRKRKLQEMLEKLTEE